MSERTERVFNIASSLVILLIAIGWSWSIAIARADGESGVTRATGIISRALTDGRAPSVAYLTDAALELVDPLRGESGRLQARIQNPGETLTPDKLARDTLPEGTVATFSTGGAASESTPVLAAPRRTGIWSVALAVGSVIKPITNFSVITLKPATAKRSGRIGLYYIGNWPSARAGRVRYEPPSGFIEVTQKAQDTQLSDHFTLKDFFPHDQQSVWPKYIVVDMKLVDKMELVLADLRARGVPSKGVKVMSGFRTPQYNRGVGETGGRAALSRHIYGDAADIFIDNDGNGSMDDLNRDGRINIGDARVILAAVNRVEAAHPSLIGGCGVYAGTAAHGPFTHIDTRGHPARW